MTHHLLAVAALACGPALAQAPAQLQTPLSPSETPAKALPDAASSERGIPKPRGFGWSAREPGRTQNTLRSTASSEPGTAERQVGGWTAATLMRAGPAYPAGTLEDSAIRPAAQPERTRLPSDG